MKFGAKASEGVQLLSDWIEAKPGQGSWFKKKYSSAFAVLNPKTAWVWREVEKANPNGQVKSKRQASFDNWFSKAMRDVAEDKKSNQPQLFDALLLGGPL
jgi:hypothetical protein